MFLFDDDLRLPHGFYVKLRIDRAQKSPVARTQAVESRQTRQRTHLAASRGFNVVWDRNIRQLQGLAYAARACQLARGLRTRFFQYCEFLIQSGVLIHMYIAFDNGVNGVADQRFSGDVLSLALRLDQTCFCAKMRKR